MTFLEVLTVTILGFILREAPNVQRNEELKQKFNQDIATTLAMEERISDGRLFDQQTDVLLLASITYRESRFRLPPVDGDCRTTHRLANVPAGLWPSGYVPVLKMRCNAVGPQQLNRGNTMHLPPWPEIQALFPERSWRSPEGRKIDKLTEEQLRDPATNIKLSYGVLAHWKQECQGKDGPAPAGVWFTAYRYGRCPFHYKTDKYYIDYEAKERCDLVTRMVAGLKNSSYALPQNFRCTYDKDRPAAERSKTATAARVPSAG